MKELQSLCLDIKVLDDQGAEIELKDEEEDSFAPDRVRDDDFGFGYEAGESELQAAGFTLKAESDDDDLIADDADEDDLLDGDVDILADDGEDEE